VLPLPSSVEQYIAFVPNPPRQPSFISISPNPGFTVIQQPDIETIRSHPDTHRTSQTTTEANSVLSSCLSSNSQQRGYRGQYNRVRYGPDSLLSPIQTLVTSRERMVERSRGMEGLGLVLRQVSGCHITHLQQIAVGNRTRPSPQSRLSPAVN
jgi:hypothetical protein